MKNLLFRDRCPVLIPVNDCRRLEDRLFFLGEYKKCVFFAQQIACCCWVHPIWLVVSTLKKHLHVINSTYIKTSGQIESISDLMAAIEKDLPWFSFICFCNIAMENGLFVYDLLQTMFFQIPSRSHIGHGYIKSLGPRSECPMVQVPRKCPWLWKSLSMPL